MLHAHKLRLAPYTEYISAHIPHCYLRLTSLENTLTQMSDDLVPPPRRENVQIATKEPEEKSKWSKFSASLFEKGIALNDWAAGHVNHLTERT